MLSMKKKNIIKISLRGRKKRLEKMEKILMVVAKTIMKMKMNFQQINHVKNQKIILVYLDRKIPQIQNQNKQKKKFLLKAKK